MEIRPIKSWRELLDFFEETGKRDVIYRGVTKDSYELLPKVGRKDTLRTEWSIDVEKHIMVRFRRLALPHLDHPPLKQNHSDWLVIGQHHGLPTRLLDWTENPLAATFFAVEWNGEEGEGNDVAVYVEGLPKIVLDHVDNFFDIKDVKFLYPPHITTRVIAQNGVFTVHPNPTTPYDSGDLIKLVIPSGLRMEIQIALDAFGVNRASLFPDLDGIAALLEWQFKFIIGPMSDGTT